MFYGLMLVASRAMKDCKGKWTCKLIEDDMELLSIQSEQPEIRCIGGGGLEVFCTGTTTRGRGGKGGGPRVLKSRNPKPYRLCHV